MQSSFPPALSGSKGAQMFKSIFAPVDDQRHVFSWSMSLPSSQTLDPLKRLPSGTNKGFFNKSLRALWSFVHISILCLENPKLVEVNSSPFGAK